MKSMQAINFGSNTKEAIEQAKIFNGNSVSLLKVNIIQQTKNLSNLVKNLP